MSKLKTGKPIDIIAHVKDTLNIDLSKHLTFTRMGTLKAYSLVPPLLVLYRYGEALNQKIEIRDMMAGGHKSHLLGSELDFNFPGKRVDPVSHIRIASDLLNLKDTLRPKLCYRIGFKFCIIKGGHISLAFFCSFTHLSKFFVSLTNFFLTHFFEHPQNGGQNCQHGKQQSNHQTIPTIKQLQCRQHGNNRTI